MSQFDSPPSRLGDVQVHLSKALEELQHMEEMDLTTKDRALVRIYLVQIEDEVKRLAP